MSIPVKSSVLFPDGTQFFTDHIETIQVAAAVVSIGFGASLTTYNYSAQDAGAAWLIGQQINDAINGVTPGLITLVNNATVYTISSITPASFDITQGTVTILGSGFIRGLLGKLRIEDSPGGGLDSNGYYMNCTYVSSTELTARFGDVGDGVLGPGALSIYYEDSLGIQSNVIAGTNPSATLVTIP